MRERGILFSTPMVKALLAGTKTVTRRIIRPQPQPWPANPAFLLWRSDEPLVRLHLDSRCPHGKPGERLWVRETWNAPPGSERREEVAYRADFDKDPAGATWRPSLFMPRWASRITLEIVDVRAERLQQISEADAKAEGISMVPFYPDDGLPLSQGFMFGKDDGQAPLDSSAVRAFARLWDAINGERASWASDPWVWAISFRRLP